MAKSTLIRCAVFSLAAIASCGLVSQVCVGADPNSNAARVDAFAQPNGPTYFALSLKPGELAPSAGPRDVVILFNTSAGQIGEYRTKALEALKTTLGALGANDRVQLMAIDLNAIPLTEGFVAAEGKEMAGALAALTDRVPLGATDMEKALTAVTASFAGDTNNAHAVLYIGDGRSMARVLGTAQFEKLVDRLTSARIPVNSCIIGARVDLQLPGALAMNTGGNLVVDQEGATAADLGHELAAAADASVLWPVSIKLPAEVTEVFPNRTPPLRSDRDTVLIGAIKGNAPLQAEIDVETPKGPEKLTWSAPPAVPDDINSYLARLVERARVDGGACLPLVDSSSLAALGQEINSTTRNVTRLAQQAWSTGNIDAARKMVDEALREDPTDADALSLKKAMTKHANDPVAAEADSGAAGVLPPPPETPIASTSRAAAPAANAAEAGADGDLNLVGPNPVAGAPAPEGALAEGILHDRRVMTQVIQSEVINALTKARGLMGTDPETASQQLKLALEQVRKAPELDPGVREQFQSQLEVALREAARRKYEVEIAQQQRLENAAAGRERVMLTDSLLQNQEKAKQLMAQLDSLMEEHRYELAEQTGTEFKKLADDKLISQTDVPQMAIRWSQAAGYYENMRKHRKAVEKGVVDTLYQVELVFIPFSDDPPIVYPDAEKWQQLTALRKDKWSAVDLVKRSPAEKRIEQELKKPTQLNAVDMPLQDALNQLADYHGITIQLQKKKLEEAGVGPDTPVTINVKGITLKSALKRLLSDLDLTVMIQDEMLLVTTNDDAQSPDNMWPPRVYPVADLVTPIQSGMGMGGGMGGMGGGMMGGGMGGMGGGMGGMGGGMGGMGMGGGMGGMGGGMMGGGMGGMGMFNVPREVLPKRSTESFQAFAVKDDLAVPPAKAEAKTSPDAKVPAVVEATSDVKAGNASDHRPTKITLEVPEGVNPETAWNEYFAANEPQPAAVRDAVRKLMERRKLDQVIACINGALRNHQAQPWMYEALALALETAGRPKSEVERAVMSAVDFADNTDELMYIAAYLTRLGLNDRALQIYRQVSEWEPLRPEPYMAGLKAAQAVNDLEGLKWASLGILNQAWPKEQASVWQAGVGLAEEVLERLRAEGRTKEFEQFHAALDEAVQRDCVVMVTYAGDAEIDLLVEEPSGTVCSLREPRTIAGGSMLGDALAQTGRDNLGGRSEVYVCPKGFDGTYRVLIRRIWGDVAGGKVTVEVITHYAAANSADVRKKIALDNDETMVVFDLKDGRRKEALRDQQVANAVDRQLVVNRQILSQQLQASTDASVLQRLDQSRTSDNTLAADNTLSFTPRAVGYQPVITILPSGTMLRTQAVVSADRRYVRITPFPFFSAIASVSTFNMMTGATGTSSGATGSAGTGATGFGGSSSTAGTGSF